MSKLIARKNIREGVDLAVIETGKASGGLIGTFVNLNLVEMPSDLDFSQFTRVDSKGVKLIHRLSHQVSRAKKGVRIYNNSNRIKESKENLNMLIIMTIFELRRFIMKILETNIDFKKKDFTCWVVGNTDAPPLMIKIEDRTINIHFKNKDIDRKFFQGSNVDLILIHTDVSKEIMDECLLRVYSCKGKISSFDNPETVVINNIFDMTLYFLDKNIDFN